MKPASMEWTAAQRTAIEIEGRDVLVTAGAGTGKTSVLVARILRKLRDGVAHDLDRLLVVTFTEKAASEMKGRIHAALAHDPQLRRLLPQLPRAPISTIHAFCARLLREQFLRAGVEPGFRILDEQASVEALEEALRKTFHSWYVREDEEGREFQRLVELAGFTEDGEGLRQIVRRLYQFARATREPDLYLKSLAEREAATSLEQLPWFEGFRRGLASDWKEALSLYAHALEVAERQGHRTESHRALLSCLAGFDPREFADVDRRTAFLEQLRREGHLSDSLHHVFHFPTAPRGAAKLASFKWCHDSAKEILSRDRRLVPRLFDSADLLVAEDAYLLRSLRVLVALVGDMSAVYERYKERTGALDYSDLEVRVARLLRDHGEELGLADRFDEILIDEYQDVNALQESILAGLSRPGRRFRVGDVKQSIYRFRLADPTIFLGHAKCAIPLRDPAASLPGHDPVAIFLNENHRSRPEILAFVNRVFLGLMNAETIGSPYEEQALAPSRPSAGRESAVELHWIETTESKDESSVDSPLEPLDLRELQPRLVARRLRAMANDAVLRDEGGTLDWGRVAILLRARTHAAYFVDALTREGIPAHVGDGGSLLEEPVVRDLVMLLRLIDNPRDDVTVAAVLRSPIFGLGDGDLLRIRLAFPGARSYLDAVVGSACLDAGGDAEGLLSPDDTELPSLLPPAPTLADRSGPTTGGGAVFDGRAALFYWAGPPRGSAAEILPMDLRRRLARALRRVVAWRHLVEESALGRFLQQIAADTHLQALVSGAGGGAHRRACLEKLFGLARSFEAERGPSLRGFLSRLDALEHAGGIDSVPLSAAGGVRILTVHKSKGLEFPVVVVPQLDWRFSGKDRLASRIRIGPNYAGLRRFDPDAYSRVDGLARQVLEHEQERELREEEARVLYVALTRARERLLLVAAGSRPDVDETVDEVHRAASARRAWQSAPWIVHAIPWGQRCEGTTLLLRAMRVREDAPRGRGASEMAFADLSLAVTIVPKECLTEPERADNHELPEVPRDLEASATVEAQPEAALVARSLGEAESNSATAIDSLGSEARVSALLGRLSKLSSRPPTASIDGLRGKYWVTEFGHTGDRAQLAELREEAAGLWIPSFFDAEDSDGATVHFGDEMPPARVPEEGMLSPAAAPPMMDPGPVQSSGTRAGTHPSVGETASERGVRYHMALARIDLAAIAAAQGDEVGEVARQLVHLRTESWWAGAEIDLSIERGIGRFFQSELGRELCAASTRDAVAREIPFSLKWSVTDLVRQRPDLIGPRSIDPRWTRAQWDDALDRAWVLLQGRIDCLFQSAAHWTLIDWKSDRIGSEAAPERAARYRSQMELYASAVSRLWGGPVRSYLVFLVPGVSIEI